MGGVFIEVQYAIVLSLYFILFMKVYPSEKYIGTFKKNPSRIQMYSKVLKEECRLVK